MDALTYLKHKRLERELKAREKRFMFFCSLYLMALVWLLIMMGKLYF